MVRRLFVVRLLTALCFGGEPPPHRPLVSFLLSYLSGPAKGGGGTPPATTFVTQKP